MEITGENEIVKGPAGESKGCYKFSIYKAYLETIPYFIIYFEYF